jgi:hypothetical protein
LLVSSCFVSLAWAIEPLFPWKCLLRVDLSISNFLAASDIFVLLEPCKNAIASLIGAMVAEESRVEVVLFTEAEVCPTAECAPRLESF